MKTNLAKRFKNALRNPIWTPIGVFVAFTSLIATILLSNWFLRPAPAFRNRLMFSSETAKDLSDIAEPVSNRLKILIDGKEERDLRLFIFRVEYKGDQPLRPSDFASPIIGRIPANRKILAVQKSPNLEGPLRYDRQSESMERDTQPPVNFEANIVDAHSFDIKPLLMNPGEWLGLEIYTSTAEPGNYVAPKDSTEKYKELSSEVSWSCHIANIECPGQVDLQRDYDYAGFDQPTFLEVNVMHMGWSVYFIVLFDILNLIVLIVLARSAGFPSFPSWLQLILFALGIALSIATAEIMADYLLPLRVFGIRFYVEQPLYAWIIFWANIAIMIVLLVISILRKRKTKRRSRSGRAEQVS
jgi:hypothetical protein